MSSRVIEGVRDVVSVRSLLLEGTSRHDIASAVGRGILVRVRRGWVAARDADPMLVAAAQSGVVLTCVTQAKRLGCWVIDDGVVRGCPAARRARRGRWSRALGRPAIPRRPDSLVDPIENVLAVVARCQPRDAALAIWNSALHSGLIDIDVLRRLSLSPAAQALLDEATLFADSGLESVVVPRLRWLGLPMRRQIWIAGHRVDLLIGEKLVLQIDGGHHVGAQRTRDIEHDARLMLMGYHVIRVGYDQVMNGWPAVQELIMRAVAQGLHRGR